MWYLSLLFILFLIIIFTYFVKEYRRYRLELDKTLLEYHSYVVKMDKLEKENSVTKESPGRVLSLPFSSADA